MALKTRTSLLYGENEVAKLGIKTVLVLGLGGVGGYTVECLARTGIGHLILVDFDTIDESNLNRQMIALTSTIGRKKTEVWKERIALINPFCQVSLIEQKITKETVSSLLIDVDFIIDACDTLEVKEELLRLCMKQNIPLLTATGTACKKDPQQLKIMELKNTSYDPIAKRLRKMVKEERIKGKIMVVASSEPLVARTTSELPSSIFVPATAGILCAQYVITKLMED